jgi:hypothetical protein
VKESVLKEGCDDRVDASGHEILKEDFVVDGGEGRGDVELSDVNLLLCKSAGINGIHQKNGDVFTAVCSSDSVLLLWKKRVQLIMIEGEKTLRNNLSEQIGNGDWTSFFRLSRFGDTNHSVNKPACREPSSKEHERNNSA